jgi:hypothetical protein
MRTVFRLILGITGLCEAILGIAIVLFATYLQHYLAPEVLPEPLYLRIVGMMDFYIGLVYILIALNPDKHLTLNKATRAMRLGLACLFFVEGVWLLETRGLRLLYQFLAFFDFFLFTIQSLYLRRAARRPRPKKGAYAAAQND